MSNLVLIVNEFECHMILESPEVGFAKKQMAQSLRARLVHVFKN